MKNVLVTFKTVKKPQEQKQSLALTVFFVCLTSKSGYSDFHIMRSSAKKCDTMPEFSQKMR